MEWQRHRGWAIGIGWQPCYGYSYIHLSIGPGWWAWKLPFSTDSKPWA